MSPTPGAYQLTPPNFAPAVLPGWGAVTPFALRSGSQFRPAPPKFFDLTGAEYAADYNEVKAVGELNSATRTAEQSEIVRFWYEGSPNGWNRIARVVAAQRTLDPWRNARLFGLLNMRIDTAGGDYRFLRCGGNEFTLDGRGELLRAGCVLALIDSKVVAVINQCPKASPDRGHAIVRVSPRFFASPNE